MYVLALGVAGGEETVSSPRQVVLGRGRRRRRRREDENGSGSGCPGRRWRWRFPSVQYQSWRSRPK